MSHFITAPADNEIYTLPGPAALRKYFFPRQRIKLVEAAKILGISYVQLYRLDCASQAPIPIRNEPGRERFVLLEDVIKYLFPESSTLPPLHFITTPKKRGRPRKPSETRKN